MKFTLDEARRLLDVADVFYPPDDEDDDRDRQVINFNDTWAWALAYGQEVSDDEMPEVARLFWRYGWCGLLYWCSERNEGMRSEFHDINRFVDFVRHEEEILKDYPSSTKRAYQKKRYEIGIEE